MAAKHGAIIFIRGTEAEVVYRVVKVIDGHTDYAMETPHAVNAIECALDMARGYVRNVQVKPDVHAHFCTIGLRVMVSRWSIMSNGKEEV